MQTCETCQHWEKATGTERWQAFGTCRGIPFVESVAGAVLIAAMRKRLQMGVSDQEAEYIRQRLGKLSSIEESKAYTEGEEGERAELRTRSSFGCANHEPRA